MPTYYYCLVTNTYRQLEGDTRRNTSIACKIPDLYDEASPYENAAEGDLSLAKKKRAKQVNTNRGICIICIENDLIYLFL